jgi:hypothetical protein
MKSRREPKHPKPIDVSKLPQRFLHEEPDPNAYQRFMRVMAGLVAVPKAEAMVEDSPQKAVRAKIRKVKKHSAHSS